MDGAIPFSQDPNPSPPTDSQLRNYALNETQVLGLFGAIFCPILMLFILVYVYPIMRRTAYFREHSPGSSWLRWIEEGVSISRVRNPGLDAKIIEALPMLVYTSHNLKDEEKPECTICLSDFEEGDKVRVLPNCSHTFHIECIDAWFSSHSSCPLCRADVEAHAEAVVVDNTVDARSSNESDDVVVVVVDIGVIEEGQSNGVSVEEESSKFSSARESEEISSPSASHSGRFSRLHSLKRMLSRDGGKKGFPSSLHQTPRESEGQSQC